MGKKQSRANLQWRTIDLHMHTPASSDYQQPEVSFLDILLRAEARGLDIIAFTDHNTIAGYRRMQDEIQQLDWLEKLNRLLPEERNRLSEYRRLTSKILVLPGVEISATFGFHILGIFSPEKPVREIEHLLLMMNIPPNQLDEGSATVGATLDVLSIYRILNQAGGLVIAAHANSSNGVAMRGFSFGGQTKIAYTQDPNLHALEVTDLEQTGNRTTAAFFNGTKPEYPRRMHSIQGSDAHRLALDPNRKKNLGIGDRATDVLLPEVNFEALQELFLSNDFSRTRPHRVKEEPVYDFIQAAMEQGANIIQDFHESITVRGGKLYAIIADICAFANTNGGTLYLGLTCDSRKPPLGIQDPEQAINQLEKEINNRISPPLQCTIDVHELKGKKLLRVLIPRGDDPPYAVDDNKIYVRNEDETGLAVRDEIVGLVLRGQERQRQVERSTAPAAEKVKEKRIPQAAESEAGEDQELKEGDLSPRTGVEVLPPIERDGARYFTMRDLRNGNVVKNVTRSSARRLWHYAIQRYQEVASDPEQAKMTWQGDYGLIRRYKQGKTTLYDLAQKTPAGIRYFFGVTQDGIHGPWKMVAGEEEA
ncbi:MAG TPA: RNA-binding domain-containing protein [Anaerolineaceae bacterium]|nr:RNA-binding domain-containing protein [Anaerolineaceae bacterium]